MDTLARGEGVDATWYQAWKNDPFDPDLAMRRDTRWIRTKMNQGYDIVDIGPDASRADPYGPFYGMESSETASRGYPMHQMDWRRRDLRSAENGDPGIREGFRVPRE